MKNSILAWFLTLLILPLLASATSGEPLPPEQAFRFSASAKNADTISAEWSLADGYYLYHDKFKFSTDTPGITLGTPQIPAGKKKQDPFFGQVETHRHKVSIEIPIERTHGAPNNLKLTASSQGCADLGICYPPYETVAQVELPASAAKAATPEPKPDAVKSISELGPSLGLQDQSDEFLDPDKAFVLSTEPGPDKTVVAHWKLADGYYLYRDKFTFELKQAPDGVSLGTVTLPQGETKNDDFFGRIQVFHKQVTADIPIDGPVAGKTIKLQLRYQGCAEAGLCYPPITKTVRLQIPIAAAATTMPVESPTATAGLDAESDQFLDPDKAFVLSTEPTSANTVVAHWKLADGYYLYRDKFKFELQKAPDGVSLGKVDLPQGETKNDDFFGRIQVFHKQVTADIPIDGPVAGKTIELRLRYQGCAEAGLCYPPIIKTVSMKMPPATTVTATAPTEAGPTATASGADKPAPTGDQEPVSEQDQLVNLLKGGNTWAILSIFFLAGLGLSLTPCVFPMIPILSGIIVGQGAGLTTRKAFVLSLIYVLAMALTYTAAGVIAGKSGENLQAAFQNPWILGAFAAIFVALAMSMFGFYDIQMPAFLQSKLTEISNRQRGGTLTGVAIMGFLSALIVGPCVAAPLAGALIFIGQTGDAVLGGIALFALSMGMGAPLLAIGTSGGKLLPKAGAWMDSVKAVFGVLMLGVAIWMLERVLPGRLIMVLWALLLIISAVYMGALQSLLPEATGWRKLWKGVGVSMVVYGSLLLIGAGTGGTDPLQPLERLAVAYNVDLQRGASGNSTGTRTAAAEGLAFKRIKGLDDLEREVASASREGKPVMLDFYADWCVSCKEFEKYTFNDRRVQQALSNTVLLQADVTQNNAADKALMKHYSLIGPPTILFFGPDGSERKRYRVVGYMDANEFLAQVQRAVQ
jgi:thiol:disulfide interchange protein DsbD